MSFVIMIDADNCSGCQMCEVACSLRNMQECNPERSRIRVVKSQLDGQLEFVPSTCMQCETAMCELVCPVNAISRDPETGARIVSEKKCVGCSSCSYACPFGACFVDRRLGKSVVCYAVRRRPHLCQGLSLRVPLPIRTGRIRSISPSNVEPPIACWLARELMRDETGDHATQQPENSDNC
jgi:Fe-S-cluster-containing hydrogenase component 2